ncbi:phage Gp37/Gp68 family protein [Methylobacterium radiotolerans]|uniref:Gp37Gp68 family protein n=1 Tax=Methylobacterium radiotolerans (strain ATCC 27329 / DSM 1819 / JCM 2831 / NBRC 15690 / NCIMB 10815 / 0-1) TaxID=426355 RepID=B1M2P1_METRJ|nr:phage Gp37/Gp68 family protein [Methylobacterium radiotolerans]ACB27689.1 Gp37Gp68 family protein [Methylobacterium radiotolerans JCM 2831]GEM95868.1 hypothetical protein MRA01_04080 [Methylobacterium radiotolerans]
MAESSTIEWTDATWQPITGCAIVSPGCTNCYAMKLAGTRLRNLPSRVGLTVETKAGPVWNGKVRLNEEWLLQPLTWRRPRKIFVCAHGDLFTEGVPDAWIDRVVAVMALAGHHTFQVLTKRPARMRAYFASLPERIRTLDCDSGLDLVTLPLRNVWLGVSAEDQRRADERVPDLLATPAAVRFVSAEPLLGPIDFRALKPGPEEISLDALTGAFTVTASFAGGLANYQAGLDALPPLPSRRPGLDWIIVGGESGHGARPMHPDWARQIRDACAAAGVAYLFKQWGSWGPGAAFDAAPSARTAYLGEIQTLVGPGSRTIKIAVPTRMDDVLGPPLTLKQLGKKAAGRLLDGVEHNGFPEVARG